MNKNKLIEKVGIANRELKKVREYFTELENMGLFEYYNLKLYDLFYECDNTEDFYNFCEYYYDMFIECVSESCDNNDFESLAHYIGRTSSFYLIDTNKIIIDRFTLNYDFTIDNLFYDMFYYGSFLEFENEIINIDSVLFPFKDFVDIEGTYESINNELDYIINGEFLEDLKAYFKDSITALEILKGFKESAINDFNYFVEV